MTTTVPASMTAEGLTAAAQAAAILAGNVKLSGDTVQVVNTTTGAVATGTTTIPADDTIPQNTEGFQVMSQAITPKKVGNLLRVDVVVVLAHSVANATLSAVLFQDSNANATSAVFGAISAANGTITLTYTTFVTAAALTATTFAVRVGSSTAGTVTFNGAVGARVYGGVTASSITVTEIQV